MQLFPCLDLDVAPDRIATSEALRWVPPGDRIFEAEALPVLCRSSAPRVGARRTIQKPIPAQPDQHPTGKMSQGAKEVMVPVFPISNHDMQAYVQAILAVVAQPLDLIGPDRNCILAACNSFHIQG